MLIGGLDALRAELDFFQVSVVPTTQTDSGMNGSDELYLDIADVLDLHGALTHAFSRRRRRRKEA